MAPNPSTQGGGSEDWAAGTPTWVEAGNKGAATPPLCPAPRGSQSPAAGREMGSGCSRPSRGRCRRTEGPTPSCSPRPTQRPAHARLCSRGPRSAWGSRNPESRVVLQRFGARAWGLGVPRLEAKSPGPRTWGPGSVLTASTRRAPPASGGRPALVSPARSDTAPGRGPRQPPRPGRPPPAGPSSAAGTLRPPCPPRPRPRRPPAPPLADGGGSAGR